MAPLFLFEQFLDVLWILGGQGIARGEVVTLQPNGTSRTFSGYGLWVIWSEPLDGGASLFTFQYASNSVTIISDPKSHHGSLWTIDKSSTGQSFTITNLRNEAHSFWIMNLTPKY